jgi:hypothetical protein
MSARSLAFAPSGLFDILLRSVWVGVVNLPALIALGLIAVFPVVLVSFVVWQFSQIAGLIIGSLGAIVAFLYYYATATLLVALSMSGSRVGIIQLLRHLRGKVTLDLLGTGALVTAIVLGGFLLLFIPGLYFSVRYMFATPAVLLEGVTYRKALARSQALTAGRWWRCFGALVLLELFTYAVFFVIGLVASHFTFGVWFILLGEVVLMPCAFVFPILLYFDARARQDGFVDLLPLSEGA